MDRETRLQKFFQSRLEGAADLKLKELVRYTEGWSCETYRAGLGYKKEGREVSREYIIRKEPEVGMLSRYDLEKEFRVLKALMSTDMTSPEVYWFEPDPEIMGRPFYVMEKVEGEVPVPPMKDEKQVLFPDQEERRSLAEDFVDILVRLHRVDWRSRGLEFLGDPGTGRDCALYQVNYWDEMIRQDRLQPFPLVTQAVLWLQDHLPAAERVSILHGDYRTGNYVARDGRIRAILDWELVHLGDPMEELAYIIDLGWRSGPPDFLVSHLMTEEEFLDRYEAKSGYQVSRESLDFYRVLNALKAVALGVGSSRAFSGGEARDLRIAVFHYRSYPFFYVLAKTLGMV